MKVFAFAAALFSLTVAGCGLGDLFGGSSSAVLGEDGGVCTKDLEELTDILVHPQSCVTTEQCPMGSFCDLEHGTCDWQCYADSDCGFGGVCSCRGQCGTGDAGPAGDPTCPRDEDKLLSLLPPNERACVFDEDCPYGSRCDWVTGVCAWDCLSTDDPMHGCPEGKSCDCRGECVGDDGGGAIPEAKPLVLEVSPDRPPVFPEVDATWDPRRVNVALRAPAGVTPPMSPSVHVRAIPGLLVTCNPTGRLTGPYGRSCDVTGFVFAPVGTFQRATVSVWIKPEVWTESTETPIPTAWRAVFRSDDAGPPALVTAVAVDPPAGGPGAPPPPQPFNGVYHGTATLTGPSGGLAVPVTAYASGTSVVLHDPLRVIAPTGGVSLGATGTTSATGLVDAADYADLVSGTGSIGATVLATQRTHSAQAGEIDGAFDTTVSFTYSDCAHAETVTGAALSATCSPCAAAVCAQSNTCCSSSWASTCVTNANNWCPKAQSALHWTYHLDRDGDLASCSIPAECAPGEICSGGFCMPPSGGSAAGNRVAYGPLADWSTELTRIAPTVPGASYAPGEYPLGPGIYDTTVGIASVDLSGHKQVVSADRLVPSSSTGMDGRLLCDRDFPDYVMWAENAPNYTAALFNTSSGITTLSSTVATSNCYDLGLYPIPALGWIDSGVPCVNPTPASGPSTLFTGLPSDKRSSCTDMWENWRDAQVPPPTTPLATFLSTTCYPTVLQLQLVVGANTARHAIYICPFREALLGPLDWVSIGERSLGYDPAYATVPPLESHRFGDSVLPISGDLEVGEALVPRGVDIVTHADRGEVLGEITLGSGEMVAACAADLDRAASVAPLEGDAAYDAYYEPGACLSPAQYYGAVYAFRRGVVYDQTRNTTNLPAGKRLERMMAQWLTLHGFLAEEGGNAQALSQAISLGLDGDPLATDAASVPGFPTLLDREAAGWNLVFGYEQSVRLFALPPEALRTPDYRSASDTVLHHEQNIGLPAFLLEGAAQHLGLLREYLVDTQFQSYGECYQGGSSGERDDAMARASRDLRYTLAAQALAEGLYDRATRIGCTTSAQCGTGNTCGGDATCYLPSGQPVRTAVSWEARYQSGLQQLAAARQQAAQALQDVEACKNPLGFGEDEFPLFFGDPQGDSSRYFASSDYLLNGWAIPAVSAATGSFEAARAAWLQRRESVIQQTLTDDEAERRGDDLAARYGGELATLCGLTEMESKDVLASFNAGTFAPETCFFDPGSAACQPTPAEVIEQVTQESARFRLCVIDQLRGEIVIDTSLDPFAEQFDDVTLDGAGHIVLSGHPSLPADTLYTMAVEAADPSAVDAAKAECAELLDGAEPELPNQFDVTPDVEDAANCYRGTLGESYLGIKGAAKNIEVATAAWDGDQRRYDLQFQACVDKLHDATIRDAITTAHFTHMQELAKAKAEAGFWGSFLGGIVEFVGAVAVGGPLLGIASLAMTVSEIGVGSFSSQMEQAELAYAEITTLLASQAEVRACFHEADMLKVAIDTSARQVQRAMVDGNLALLHFNNERTRVSQVILEGNAAVAREAGREVPSIAFHYWLDERVDRFQDDFAWAKRLTYLAMRAVEYEFQQSLGLRDQILTATHPGELEDVVRLLQQEQITRTINSRRPEEAVLVVSLRDEIQHLGERIALEPGERQATPAQRFQQRLIQPEYAVWDDDRRYLGQGVPFTLDPRGPLAQRCGERLWRVTATVQGDLLDVDAPSVSLFLVKRNHFGSQWCDGRGDGSDLQEGALLPASRLFPSDAHGGTEAEELPYTAAMIQPYLNVRRGDFYRDSFAEGSSEELAGRGLYGEYVLLFPQDGLLDEGFPLDQVEDVLLRFDYLSVDDLSGF